MAAKSVPRISGRSLIFLDDILLAKNGHSPRDDFGRRLHGDLHCALELDLRFVTSEVAAAETGKSLEFATI